MSQLIDLIMEMKSLQDDLDAIKGRVQKQADAIAALSAAAPGVMTQAQLDALDAEAKAILGAPAPSFRAWRKPSPSTSSIAVPKGTPRT